MLPPPKNCGNLPSLTPGSCLLFVFPRAWPRDGLHGVPPRLTFLNTHSRGSVHMLIPRSQSLQTGSHDRRQAESASMSTRGATGDLPTTAEEELTLPAQPPSLGRNAMEYLERAAVARSLLIGDIVYNFTAGPERRKASMKGQQRATPHHHHSPHCGSPSTARCMLPLGLGTSPGAIAPVKLWAAMAMPARPPPQTWSSST